jgi:hypothetical protein
VCELAGEKTLKKHMKSGVAIPGLSFDHGKSEATSIDRISHVPSLHVSFDLFLIDQLPNKYLG